MNQRLVKFAELRTRGIVTNRPTLKRWIAREGFPRPMILGANSLAWSEAEVEAWLASRRRGSVADSAAA